MYRKYELLESKICKELDLLEEKYRTGAEMSEGDLRRLDLLAHSIKSLATYSAMKEAEENRSYPVRQQRQVNNNYDSSYNDNMYPQREMTNRFVSRENHPPASGLMSYYPEERRW